MTQTYPIKKVPEVILSYFHANFPPADGFTFDFYQVPSTLIRQKPGTDVLSVKTGNCGVITIREVLTDFKTM